MLTCFAQVRGPAVITPKSDTALLVRLRNTFRCSSVMKDFARCVTIFCAKPC